MAAMDDAMTSTMDNADTIFTMATMMTVDMHEDNVDIDEVARRQRPRQC